VRILLGATLLGVLAAPIRADGLKPISDGERIALEKLYASTGGTDWCNHDGWLGARGTECDWHGIFCGFAQDDKGERQSVWELDLADNNLVGTLPPELDRLEHLEYLRLYENQLTGSAPPGILERWERGTLQFQGFAELEGVWEIRLQYLTVVYCMDYEAILRSDGTASLTSERCNGRPRMRWQGQGGLRVSCETQTGWTDRFGDAFGRLARLLDTQSFYELGRDYDRSITHGADMIISVVRNGDRKTVRDYAEAGPMNLWLIETAIQGVIREASWEQSARSRACTWTKFTGLP
jgi:hypothetical protein